MWTCKLSKENYVIDKLSIRKILMWTCKIDIFDVDKYEIDMFLNISVSKFRLLTSFLK